MIFAADEVNDIQRDMLHKDVKLLQYHNSKLPKHQLARLLQKWPIFLDLWEIPERRLLS